MEAKGSIDFVKYVLFSEAGNARYDTFCIDKNKWEKFETSFRFEKKKWRTVKFFQDDGNVNPLLKNVKDDSGVFMCLIKPDSEKVPVVNYEFIMFVDGTTTSVRDALEDFVQTRSSSYLHNTEIRSLFAEYEKYLYVSYYIDGNTSHVEELKEKLIDLINPPIKNSKIMEKGSTENGFKK